MHDRDVRTSLLEHLNTRHADDDSLIVQELGLYQGATRVDIAVVNGELAGYEIKSATDTLDRFPHQQELYSQILDRAWIVAGRERFNALEDTLPDWWGIIEIVPTRGGLELNTVRPASVNQHVDPLGVAQLLWRDEAFALLVARGADAGARTKPRRLLWARLVDTYALDDLRAAVRETLKARQDWRARPRRSRRGAPSPVGARFLDSLVSSDPPHSAPRTDRRD